MKTAIIPNTNNRYVAYEDGRIFDQQRRCFITQSESTRGWLKCHLWIGGIRKTIHVHRVIMLAFCGESTLTVNHKDGNKKNNCLSNLEYMTVQEQNAHRSYALKRGNRRAVKCLNNGIIYETAREAGKALGIDCSHISHVCRHKMRHTHGYRFEYID